MVLNTRHFGEIIVQEEAIITFEEGLPGFENVRKFIILDTQNPEEEGNESPFKWLQCVDDPMLAFVIANPFVFRPNYDIELNDEVVELLGIEKEEDVVLYAIAVVPEDIRKISINLKAPLVINVRNMKGMQAILDTDKYSIRHYIMDEIARQEVGANACSDKKEGPVYCNR
ncbi:MAG: flagellar assembly protein FliW [Firmicutes bacterium]|nr:flagellar assembly protein FliW [Bacillota bacterium]